MKMLTFKNKVAYGLGDVGNNMSFALSSTFLLAFYVDVLGITAAAVGSLFLLARIFDGLNDPIMGTIAERRFAKLNNPNADKFRPFLIRGAFILASVATIMFWIPGELSAGQKLSWAYLTYFSWGIAYTFVNIPYGSLASSMTQDAEEQAELSTWRTFGAICGTAITKFMVPIMLTFFADDVAFGYLAAVAACGMIGMLAHVSAYFGTKENIRPKPEPMTPLLTQVKQLFQNKLLLAVSASALCCLTALYGIGATTMFWIKANLDNALSVLAITGVVDVIAMIGMLFITKPLIKRFGIRKLVMMCCVVTITFNLTAYFLVSNPTEYLTFYIIDKLFSMFPVALMWGLVADCIEYSHYKTGKREAGVIYASYSLSRKLAGAMAGFIAAVGIGLIGYDPALAAQTEETQAGLQAMMFLMPAVANGLMFLIFALFWDLTPKKREEMVAHNQAMLKLGAQY